MNSPFLSGVRDYMRARQYAKRTEETYLYWIRHYIRFHNNQHPDALGNTHIVAFLEYLALVRNVSPSTQRTALNAIMFMYRRVLGQEHLDIGDFAFAKPQRKLPVVLSRAEVSRLLSVLEGYHQLCAQIMYGSGLRVMEVCRLRVKDVDLDRLAILVRDGKGRKNRVTTLSETCLQGLRRQLQQVQVYWEDDSVFSDWGGVYLPYALERKYPRMPYEFAWQYLFPAA